MAASDKRSTSVGVLKAVSTAGRAIAFTAAAVPLVIGHGFGKGFFPGGLGGRFGGAFGSDSWIGRRSPGSNIDWEREAAQQWKNSAVGACLWYLCDTLPEAPFITRTAAADGKKTPVPNAELTRLLKRPNPHYTTAHLLQATIVSLEVDGNAYWRVRRNIAGRIVELWYVPHWCVEPRWESDDEFISFYEYRPGGGAKAEKIAPEDIVHFRMGLDPENTRKGLSRLRTVIREVVTDNEATTYTVSILKNFGTPGVVFTPRQGVDVGDSMRAKLKALWREKVTGDKRGEPLVLPGEFEMHSPQLTPEQMVLDKIRAIPEARICAAMRVPAMIAQLSVGDDQRTYSNMREARELAYEGTIVPLHTLLCDHISLQLGPQLAGWSDLHECAVDYSEVRVLQEDRDALAKRVAILFNAGVITRAEAKTMLGMIADKARDDVYKTDLAQQAAEARAAAAQPPEGGDPAAATDATTEAAKAVRAEWARKARERRAKFEQQEEEDGGDGAGA